jgi:hypothetical protein
MEWSTGLAPTHWSKTMVLSVEGVDPRSPVMMVRGHTLGWPTIFDPRRRRRTFRLLIDGVERASTSTQASSPQPVPTTVCSGGTASSGVTRGRGQLPGLPRRDARHRPGTPTPAAVINSATGMGRAGPLMCPTTDRRRPTRCDPRGTSASTRPSRSEPAGFAESGAHPIVRHRPCWGGLTHYQAAAPRWPSNDLSAAPERILTDQMTRDLLRARPPSERPIPVLSAPPAIRPLTTPRGSMWVIHQPG